MDERILERTLSHSVAEHEIYSLMHGQPLWDVPASTGHIAVSSDWHDACADVAYIQETSKPIERFATTFGSRIILRTAVTRLLVAAS